MDDYTAWSNAIGPHMDNLGKERLDKLLKFNGLSDPDELKIQLGKRFPGLDPANVLTNNPRLGDLIKGIDACGDGPSYEKGPSHDKEPYDKGGPYDRQGFSRT